MTIRINIKTNCNNDQLLLYLKEGMLKKGITNVSLEGDKLILKNSFFNSQSRMNPFAYVKNGELFIKSTDRETQIIYRYNSYVIPLLTFITCFITMLVLSGLPILLFVIVLSFFLLIGKYFDHIRQKMYLTRLVRKFVNEQL